MLRRDAYPPVIRIIIILAWSHDKGEMEDFRKKDNTALYLLNLSCGQHNVPIYLLKVVNTVIMVMKTI